MSIVQLPHIVWEIILSNVSTSDLVSLRSTCHFLNFVTAPYLMRNLYIYDDSRKFLQPELTGAECTFIPISKIDCFFNFLYRSVQWIGLIKSITIDELYETDKLSNFLTFLSSQNLLDLDEFKSHPNNPSLLDVLIHEKCYSNHKTNSFIDVLQENDQTDLISINDYHSNENNSLDELDCSSNDSVPFGAQSSPSSFSSLGSVSTTETHIDHSFVGKSVTILCQNDMLHLPNTVEAVEIYSKKTKKQNVFSRQVLQEWSSKLNSLTFFEHSIFDIFTNNLLNIPNMDLMGDSTIFGRLTTFSTIITDCVTPTQLKFWSLMDLSKIENFEIKFKRVNMSTSVTVDNNAKLVELLNSKLDLKVLRKFSLINLNNTNMLAENIFTNEIYSDSNFCYVMVRNSRIFNSYNCLKHLNIVMNTFLSVVEIATNGVTSYNRFVVDEEYIKTKCYLFQKIFNFSQLESLVIPDFLFNWLPFFNVGNSSIQNSTSLVKTIKEYYWQFDNFETSTSLNRSYLINKHTPRLDAEICKEELYNVVLPYILEFSRRLPKLRHINLGGVAVDICSSESHISLRRVFENEPATDWPK